MSKKYSKEIIALNLLEQLTNKHTCMTPIATGGKQFVGVSCDRFGREVDLSVLMNESISILQNKLPMIYDCNLP